MQSIKNTQQGLPTVAMLAMGMLVVVPVAFVLLQAIFPGAAQADWGQPFAHWAQLWQDTAVMRLLGNTVWLGIWVVVGSLLLGVPLGTPRPSWVASRHVWPMDSRKRSAAAPPRKKTFCNWLPTTS